MCKSGEATTHNDESHDQSLDQTFTFLGNKLRIIGGTTKCARFMAEHLESQKTVFEGKTVLELGAGTGLVGICLSLLGAKVLATDQEPMLDILQANIDENAQVLKNNIIKTQVLHWEDEADAQKCRDFFFGEAKKESTIQQPNFDFIIGSDLTYSKECMSPLVKVYNNFIIKQHSHVTAVEKKEDTTDQEVDGLVKTKTAKKDDSGDSYSDSSSASAAFVPSQETVGYLLNIMRFNWEYDFFTELSQTLDIEKVWEKQDIRLFKFTRKSK
jgi:predicted nicotinamide N-methyase